MFLASKKPPKPPLSESDKEEEAYAASVFASVVTPNAKKRSIYPPRKRTVVVRSHTRSTRKVKRPSHDYSKLIKVGTIVARSFNTWPTSRKPGDPPVPVVFQGLVTEINPRTKKIQVLFENSQNMRFSVSDLLPLVLQKRAPVEEAKVPEYLRSIRMGLENFAISNLESTSGKNEENESTSGKNEENEVQQDDDNEVTYIGTKEAPDITFVKVVPGDKPYVDIDDSANGSSINSPVTLM